VGLELDRRAVAEAHLDAVADRPHAAIPPAAAAASPAAAHATIATPSRRRRRAERFSQSAPNASGSREPAISANETSSRRGSAA
jgi:hypothetical protein